MSLVPNAVAETTLPDLMTDTGIVLVANTMSNQQKQNKEHLLCHL